MKLNGIYPPITTPFDHAGEIPHCLENESQVRMAIAAAGRGADGDEHRFGAFDALRQLLAEGQPSAERWL